MIEWWNSMDLAGQIFALIAIPSTLVLVVQTVLLLFGIGDDDIDADGIDITGNGIGDTPGDGGGDGFALFSIRGIMAMAAVGGWSGLAMRNAEMPITLTIICAAALGFVTLVGIAFIMRLASRLQSSGNIVLGYSIGKVGSVYIPIPPNMSGSGKINVTVQERFIEVDAVTPCGRRLKTGESVRITATDENGMVVVEPINKEQDN